MDKILENNKIKMIIKILIPTIISVSLVILLLNKINIIKLVDQQVKINLDKKERSSYPKTEALWATLEIPSLKN